ncbi:MAG TPA: hypothetical protein G4N92_02875 [Anaerolineae bacterium]|nr:hypothetical protein [Anaerolineae bacterium]
MLLSDLSALGEFVQGLATILVFIAAMVAVKQLRISATTDLFHRFNNPTARTHRRQVYHLCKRLVGLVDDKKDISKLEKEKGVLEHLECVCNSLDWAGLLVRRKLLNKKDAIDLYGDSLIRSWVALRHWIKITRERRRISRKLLWNNFQWLQGEAAKDDRFKDWVRDGVPIYTPTAIITIDYETSKVKYEKQNE